MMAFSIKRKLNSSTFDKACLKEKNKSMQGHMSLTK